MFKRGNNSDGRLHDATLGSNGFLLYKSGTQSSARSFHHLNWVQIIVDGSLYHTIIKSRRWNSVVMDREVAPKKDLAGGRFF